MNGGSVDSSVYQPIPTITTSNITLYEALKLICDSVECDFQIQGSNVVVRTKSKVVEDMVVTFYKVKDAFLEMFVSWVEHDMKNSKYEFESNVEDQTAYDLKRFFYDLGVGWPNGSSVRYLLSVGELKVVNTLDNHKTIEKILRGQGYLEGDPR